MQFWRRRELAPVCGPYGGEIAEAYDDAELKAWLAAITSHLGKIAAPARARGALLYEVNAPFRGQSIPLMVKAQCPPPLVDSWSARFIGTQGERAWGMARYLESRGVGTPQPVAWLERWDGATCRESYFINRRVELSTSFRDALKWLLRREQDAERIVALLADVAPAVRALHDAGVIYNDLGNQNILLQRQPGSHSFDVFFLDLSRARRTDGALSPKQRARDLDRLYLPSDLLRIFCEMYWRGAPPVEFVSALRWARRRFRWHEQSRRLRRPIRHARARREDAKTGPVYPPPRDIWIWDEKSAQPINAWASAERNRLYPFRNHALILRTNAALLAPVWKTYRELKASAFSQPVELAARWGLSVEPQPATWERERALLPARQGLPLLIRLYRHKGPPQWEFAIQAGRELAAAGYPVGFAFCQDRRAVLEPAAWVAMCEHAIPHVAAFADWIEVGHAINRVKWGLWRLADYRKLVEPLSDLKSDFPAIRLMGPAAIDFEYHFTVAGLAALPRDFKFDALSHHLYVDRRGAPENPQAGFTSVDKFALGRALARVFRHCADRLIVSEVNWPLLNTGIYSPVGAPYNAPGVVPGKPNVGERDYANYMVRYLLQAACSGFVERVYWWRLAAHGYGLVDDRAEPWRPRPAYRALLHLLDTLGNASFERNLPAGQGAWIHLFRRPNGEQIAVGYAWQPQAGAEWPFVHQRAEDSEGEPLAAQPKVLGPDPIYFRGVSQPS